MSRLLSAQELGLDVTVFEGNAINQELFEIEAKKWSKEVASLFKASIKQDMPDQSGSLAKSVKPKLIMKYDMVENVSFEFWRSGVFKAYGVGNGWIHTPMGVVKGMKSSQSKLTKKANTSPKPGQFSHLKKGIGRKPIDWFDTTVETNIGSLSDLVSIYFGDKYVMAASAGTRIVK